MRVVALVLMLLPGCYLSHGRPDVGERDVRDRTPQATRRAPMFRAAMRLPRPASASR